MTRQEFIDDVTTWEELVDFCNNECCDICEDVYSADSRDEYIDEELLNMAQNAECWQDLLDELSAIDTGDDYYRHTDYDKWVGLTEYEFYEYKDDVIDWMDDGNYWDAEEEEEEAPEEYVNPEDAESVEQEPISISDLIGACSSQLDKLNADKNTAEETEAEEFNAFVAECVVVAKER